MSKVKTDKRKSNVVSPKFGKSKGKEVAFNCECCDEPVTVDELYTGHVTQAIERLLGSQSKIEIIGSDDESVGLDFFGRRFEVLVIDPEEEGYEMADS